MVVVGRLLGGLGLGDRGDEGFFFRNKLFPDPDEDIPRSRLGGGGGGPLLPPGTVDRVGGGGGGPLLPLLLPNRFEMEFDIFRPTEGGGGAGVVRVGGGGGGPLRPGPRAEPPPALTEPPRLGGGGGGPFLVGGGGGPARVGGGGGFVPLLTPPGGVGRGNMLLGPFVVGGDDGRGLPNLLATPREGRLTAPPSPLLKPRQRGKSRG